MALGIESRVPFIDHIRQALADLLLLTQHPAGQCSLAVEVLLLRLVLHETWAQLFLSLGCWARPHQTTGTVLQQVPVRVGSAAASESGMDTTP